jgi:hypothetical protein
MGMAGLVALGTVGWQGGFQLPQVASGWWGLAALTFLYGTAFTIMFTVLPRLGRGGQQRDHECRARVCPDPRLVDSRASRLPLCRWLAPWSWWLRLSGWDCAKS